MSTSKLQEGHRLGPAAPAISSPQSPECYSLVLLIGRQGAGPPLTLRYFGVNMTWLAIQQQQGTFWEKAGISRKAGQDHTAKSI